MRENREQIIEVMARAMLTDELSVNPRSDFATVWANEMRIWISNATAALSAFRTWLDENGLAVVPRKLPTKHAYAGASYLARAGVHGVSPDAFAEAWSEVVFSLSAATDVMKEGGANG